MERCRKRHSFFSWFKLLYFFPLKPSSLRGFYLKCVSRFKRLFFYVFIGRWFSE
nr:MAG TPA: hypothetical protein [Caudoviricetes sp.]